jgi:Phosphopantetheine attachment site
MGGDSLQIVNMQASIETLLSLDIPIIDLFNYPTIFQLAQHINRQAKITMPQLNILSKHQVIAEKKKSAFQGIKKQRKS